MKPIRIFAQQHTTNTEIEWDLHSQAPIPKKTKECDIDTPARREVEFAFLGVSRPTRKYNKSTK